MPAGKLERKKFVRFKEGKVIIWISKDKVIEEEYVSGFITGVYFKMHEEYGEQMHLLIYDLVDTFDLQMSMKSGMAKAFLNISPNIQPHIMTQFIPTYKVVDGKKNAGVIIKQNDQMVPWKYTNANPGDRPPKVSYQGIDPKSGKMVEMWQDIDRMAFLKQKLVTEFVPLLPPIHVLQRNANMANIKSAADYTDFDDEVDEDEITAARTDQAPPETSLIPGGPVDDLPF